MPVEGRPVYPLATHYCQTWQHLPDYGAYHATLIADPALPGKWQPGEEEVYLLVFDGEDDGETPEDRAQAMIIARLSAALPIPVLDAWDRQLWESARSKDFVVDLQTSDDCQGGYQVQLTEAVWKEVITRLLIERRIHISGA